MEELIQKEPFTSTVIYYNLAFSHEILSLFKTLVDDNNARTGIDWLKRSLMKNKNVLVDIDVFKEFFFLDRYTVEQVKEYLIDFHNVSTCEYVNSKIRKNPFLLL